MTKTTLDHRLASFSDRIYIIETPFLSRSGPILTRSCLLLGDYAVLIDCGTRDTYGQVVDLFDQLDRPLSDLRLILLTHAHVDHIGALGQLVQASGAMVAAHTAAVPYLTNYDLHYDKVFDPFPDIWSGGQPLRQAIMANLDQGCARVDWWLEEGTSLHLGQGIELYVYHLPGHSAGQIGLYENRSRSLIVGDAIPSTRPHTLVYYEAPLALIESVKRLRRLCETLDVSWLLGGHRKPMPRSVIQERLQAQIEALMETHRRVWQVVQGSEAGVSLGSLTAMVASAYGMGTDFVTLHACYGHLKGLREQGLVRLRRDRWLAQPNSERQARKVFDQRLLEGGKA